MTDHTPATPDAEALVGEFLSIAATSPHVPVTGYENWLRSALARHGEVVRRECRREAPLFSVGYHKGEMDFGVSGDVSVLDREQMRQLREMTVVGIGQMEQMWSRMTSPRAGAACPPTRATGRRPAPAPGAVQLPGVRAATN